MGEVYKDKGQGEGKSNESKEHLDKAREICAKIHSGCVPEKCVLH